MAKLTRRALLATVAGIWITRRVSAATANTFIAGQITPAKSGTRLTLETKERQKFTYFTLEHPPRLVVDMINTPSNAALAALPRSLIYSPRWGPAAFNPYQKTSLNPAAPHCRIFAI